MAKIYAKRGAGCRLKEMDETGRSPKADRRRKATTKVESSCADRGDQAA